MIGRTENILLSVIVPIYKVEQYLDRCINSIVAQSYTNLEIILVDDGSPDNCPDKCDDWATRDNRIKVVHKANAGLGYARNSGLDIATGDYVAFVDSDDYIEPEMYETLVSAAVKHNADMVSCGFNKQLKTGEFKPFVEFDCETVFEGDDEIKSLTRMFMLSYWHKSLNVGVWHAIYRRCFVPRFTSEREYIPEDLIFCINVGLRIKKYVYVNRSFYNYMYNASGLCRSYKSDDFEKMVAGAEFLKGILEKKGLTGEAERYIFTRSNFFYRYFIMFSNSMKLREKYKEIKRLISLPAYQAMLAPEYFPEWNSKKMKYKKLGFNFQRRQKSKLYFAYLLFDKIFIAGR